MQSRRVQLTTENNLNNILKTRAERASEYEDAVAILQQGLDQNWSSNQYLQAFSDKPDSGPVYTVRTALAVNQQTAHTLGCDAENWMEKDGGREVDQDSGQSSIQVSGS